MGPSEAGWGTRVYDWFARTPDPDRVQRLRSQLFVVFTFLVAINAALFATLHTVHHLPLHAAKAIETENLAQLHHRIGKGRLLHHLTALAQRSGPRNRCPAI